MSDTGLSSILFILCLLNGGKCGSISYVCTRDILDNIYRGRYTQVYERFVPCPNLNEDGGQCVALAKCLCRAPNTHQWSIGISIPEYCSRGYTNISFGTVIATFKRGSYINDGTGHTAIFMGCTSKSCVKVYDQWCGQKPKVSVYCNNWWKYNAFYVVECKQEPCYQSPWCVIR